MRAAKDPTGMVTVPREGAFESRMATRAGSAAISTQVLPSPPSEYEDFCQRGSTVTTRTSQFLRQVVDEITRPMGIE